MALKNISLISKLILLFFFIKSSTAQVLRINSDTIFFKNFDKNLSETIISLDKPLVLFSSSNCIACVYYFSKQKHKFNYLIVLNNKSLAETAMMLSNYKLNKESVHFTTKKYYNTNLTITPSPCLVFKNNKGTFFLDYSTVSQFTNEFSLPYKKLIKKIN